MPDTILIAGMIDDKLVKSKYKYDLRSFSSTEAASIKNRFLRYRGNNIYADQVFWRSSEHGAMSKEEVKIIDYPGQTLWPKNKESTLTEVMLKTLLEENDFTYKYLDINDVFSESDLAKNILKKSCKTISLSTTHVHDEKTLLKLLQIIKKYNSACVILGGRYISDHYAHFQNLFGKSFDYVIRREGENGYTELLDCIIRKKNSLNAVCNLVWKKDGYLSENKTKKYNFDKLPTPDWNLAEHRKKYIYYEAARGCNFRCRFCTYCLTGGNLILKSAERIFEEWAYYYKNGIRNIKIYDSTFVFPADRMTELCRLLIKNNIKLNWSCYSRSTDIANQEMAFLMARAGCELVSVGIESGSPRILNNMNKVASIGDHKKALKFLEKAGILAQCGFIIGFPGETQKTIRDTYEFILKNKVRLANIQPFTIRSLNMIILNDHFRKNFKINLTEIDEDNFDWSHKTMNLSGATAFAEKIKKALVYDRRSRVSFRRHLDMNIPAGCNLYFYYDANCLIQKIYFEILSKNYSTKKADKIWGKLFDNYFVYEGGKKI